MGFVYPLEQLRAPFITQLDACNIESYIKRFFQPTRDRKQEFLVFLRFGAVADEDYRFRIHGFKFVGLLGQQT